MAFAPARTLVSSLLVLIVLFGSAGAQEVVALQHLDLERRAEVHLPPGGAAGRPILTC